MSRVGKYPVIIPEGVSASIENSTVTVKGKLGELSFTFDQGYVDTKLEENKIVVTRGEGIGEGQTKGIGLLDTNFQL